MTAVQIKLLAALAAVLLFAGGEWAWSAHERAMGAAAAKIAEQTAAARNAADSALAWKDRATAATTRADSLAAVLRADSVRIAGLAARTPTVVQCPVRTTPGAPAVLADVVPKADYDALARAAAGQAQDASRAIAAKDSVLASLAGQVAALEREHRADSAIVVAVRGAAPSFWSHFRKFAGPAVAYTADDRKLHAGAVFGFGYTW